MDFAFWSDQFGLVASNPGAILIRNPLCPSAGRIPPEAHMQRPLRLFFALVIFVSLFTPAAAETGAAQGRFLGAKETEYPSWFKQSFLELSEDVGEAADQGRRVLILFTQDGCPYCHALVEHNLAQKDIEAYVKAHFDVVLINLWGDREVLDVQGRSFTEKQFAAALKVQFTPTLVFLGESGAPVLRLDGYVPPERFKLALEYVAERQDAAMGFNDYLARHAPPPDGGQLVRQDFFRPGPHDLSQHRGPVAVFFEQGHCPNCRALYDGPFGDPETRKLAGEIHSIQLDMWSEKPLVAPDGRALTARAWARELDVKYAPTIVLLDQGREVIRSEAFFKTFHTQGILEYVRSGDYRRQPNFQRWLEARADHFRELGRDVDLWQ